MTLEEKLKVAWRRIKVDRRTDFIIGNFEYEVFERYLDLFIERIADKIRTEQENYNPEALRKIRVPKSFYSTRPGSVPCIEDRIVYQYLVDEIAEEVEGGLVPIESKVLHSYRYRGERSSADMFRFDTASYKTFERQTKLIAKSHEYLVVADISSFFESIYHHELQTTLESLGASTNNLSILLGVLRKWNKGNSYSLPQGIWPSDYLGNIYLDRIDKFMVRMGYQYCRYVDDIRIGVNSFLEGQKALLMMEDQINKIGLTLNDAKTKIIYKDDVEDELFPYRQRFDEIFNELVEQHPALDPYSDESLSDDELAGVQIEAIKQLFEQEIDLLYPNVHILRFCLQSFKKFANVDLLDFILDKFNETAVVTSKLVTYLLAVGQKPPSRKKEIINKITLFVQNEMSCYDWQEMWLLHFLDQIGNVSSDAISKISTLLMTRSNLNDAIKVHLVLLIGKYGDKSLLLGLLDLYEREHSLWVKRAILYSLKRIPESRRNHFYSYCRGQELFSDKIIDFIQSSN